MDYQEAINTLRLEGIEFRGKPRRIANFCGALDAAISAMQELQQYKQLGTLEEVRKAVEKAGEKKVTNIRGDKLKFCTCPSCEKRITNVEGGNYCQNCGQKLDWSEEDEIN